MQALKRAGGPIAHEGARRRATSRGLQRLCPCGALARGAGPGYPRGEPTGARRAVRTSTRGRGGPWVLGLTGAPAGPGTHDWCPTCRNVPKGDMKFVVKPRSSIVNVQLGRAARVGIPTDTGSRPPGFCPGCHLEGMEGCRGGCMKHGCRQAEKVTVSLVWAGRAGFRRSDRSRSHSARRELGGCRGQRGQLIRSPYTVRARGEAVE